MHHEDRDVRHLQYVDNFAGIGVDRDNVDMALKKVLDLMTAIGLPTHEIQQAQQRAELLGWDLDGTHSVIRPTRKRTWKIKLAALALISHPFACSTTIEKLIGHMTFVALLERESLSCFEEVTISSRQAILALLECHLLSFGKLKRL